MACSGKHLQSGGTVGHAMWGSGGDCVRTFVGVQLLADLHQVRSSNDADRHMLRGE